MRTGAAAFTAALVLLSACGRTSKNPVGPTLSSVLVAKPGGPYTDDSGRLVTFSGLTSTSTPFAIAHYYWNCGQGSIHLVACEQDTPTPQFRYAKIGGLANITYTVSLRVVDTAGNSSPTVTTTITVRQTYEII